ncbi:MAG: DNA topoisomerase (ATP-hydrolyzing) subunit A [Eubacteriales bacterium]|jgi:DNA gyrase subunit A|nr:topoisomerase IV [Clostridiales bacterium]
MARKKNEARADANTKVTKPAVVIDQPITETIETNYMPYVMTVIVSRAIPEIDGFKPAHRKLLYTMYRAGLMNGPRTKSANIVGQTMRLNPHSDAAIYETMVRLTRANGALLHPFIDSKGSFGKHYSSDMKYAAPRYTEAKLEPICAEIFRGIDKNTVDMVDNYDGTMKEPVLLPTTFPNILANPNMGIAVGMASNICSFNLAELCDGTISLLKNPKTSIDKLLDIIKGPDFPGGGQLIYDREEMAEIYRTGQGNLRLRAKYVYNSKKGTIEIIEIPYTTTIEVIQKKLTELIKEGKLKEVTDFRDEIDLSGFKLAIDVRRGTDVLTLMEKLYRLTPLEDTFKCNFNLLIDGVPKTLGVADILLEWIRFRSNCYRRELTYDLTRMEEKLHLLRGLGKILLDIDRAIRIVRETEEEKMVVPNLMEGFGIDEKQAEYIAEIKLRNLNKEYIINRIREIESLQAEIARLKDIINDDIKLKGEIIKQLTEIKRKYRKPRQTELIGISEIEPIPEEALIDNYNVRILLTKGGYFKKITLQSLRGNDEQKLKEGDFIVCQEDAENRDEILMFSNKVQVYKAKLSDFEDTKASALGDYVPAKLDFDEDEGTLNMCVVREYRRDFYVLFLFENGKGVRIPLSAYETKSNRRKLTNAYSSSSPPVAAFLERGEPFDVMIVNSVGKAIIISSSQVPVKETRTSVGVQLFNLKSGQRIVSATAAPFDGICENPSRYRKNKLPATGVTLSEKDGTFAQLRLI